MHLCWWGVQGEKPGINQPDAKTRKRPRVIHRTTTAGDGNSDAVVQWGWAIQSA
jgi:hypothetical protein